MAVPDAILALALMALVLPLIVSPFLLTPLSVGAVASGTFVVAQGVTRRGLMAWLGFLTAVFLIVLAAAAFILLTTPV